MPQGRTAISIRRFSIVEKIDFLRARTDKAAISGAQRKCDDAEARENTARLLPFSELTWISAHSLCPVAISHSSQLATY